MLFYKYFIFSVAIISLMRKFVKNLSLISIFVALLIILSAGFYLGLNLIKFSDSSLNIDALNAQNVKIEIYDKNSKLINDENSFETKHVKLYEMPPHTYEAFISIEDKKFYTHKGINPKRIVGATLKNIKTLSFKEGASTISQQLIKNTHLSSEKTINRKMKEIILTKKMEKILSKDEILEDYLNVIYFGNNCYGVSAAAKYYFSKECKDITLPESATLAGMIKAPNKYSPISNPEVCLKRRNLVLKEMFKDKKISEIEYEKAKETPLGLKINAKTSSKLNTYGEMVIDEAQKILHLPAKQISLAKYKIYTYQNPNEQQRLLESLNSTDFLGNDYAGIVIDSKLHGITAFYGNSTYKILEAKRSPGSCLKPILIYAPALNEDIISPETQILDEKLKIGEYSPENVGGKYHGYISAKEALSKSINIPAVKVLSYVGIDKAKCYAKKMGISFDKDDTSYSLALGGMTYGINLKDLTNAYSTFASEGKFCKSNFISQITNSNGDIIYRHIPHEKEVLRKDATYLLTDMLKETAKTGTSKKLSDLDIDIASKTGTVGINGSKLNLDAWNISYTPSKVCGVWTGNLDNKPISIAGGNQPTEVVKKFFSNFKNEEFAKPNEIVFREIDTIELEENHRLTLANSDTPERFKKVCMFSVFNLPAESQNFSILPQPKIKAVKIDGKNYILLNAKRYLIYSLFDDKNKEIKKIADQNGDIKIPVSSNKIKIKTSYISSKNFSEKEVNFV